MRGEPVSAGYPSARANRSCAARQVRVFPGQPARVAEVRMFVAAALADCPAREALLSCASELAANAILHTASGAGGVFAVEVTRPADGRAMVAVTDAGGLGEPSLRDRGEPSVRDPVELAEGGRGLALVAALASRWGHRVGPGGGRTVWAEVTWPVAIHLLSRGTHGAADTRVSRYVCIKLHFVTKFHMRSRHFSTLRLRSDSQSN